METLIGLKILVSVVRFRPRAPRLTYEIELLSRARRLTVNKWPVPLESPALSVALDQLRVDAN